MTAAPSGKTRFIGFVVNPIAGMGGRIGLKGTDGVADRAVALGAEPSAATKAARFLGRLGEFAGTHTPPPEIHWLSCAGEMGADALAAAGIPSAHVRIVHQPSAPSRAADTLSAVKRFAEAGVDLILFCGGDGTARDIAGLVGTSVPLLGVPAGVKMFSGVFGASPEKTAEILVAFLRGEIGTAEVEVLDLDEEAYREGRWQVRLYQAASTPFEPSLTQPSKMLIHAADEAEVAADIAAHVRDHLSADRHTLFLLGPGSTVRAVKQALGIEGTMLGIDAVAGGRSVGEDLDERGILGLLDRYPDRRLILSPIGAQGFVIGRGNLQLSPRVIRRIGRDALVVVASPAKLERTPLLRFDTGEPELDRELYGNGYIAVVTGYGYSRTQKIAQ